MNENSAIFTEAVRVGTYECDFLGKWKLATFFQHLTAAAGSHSQQLGCGLDVMNSYNVFWVLSRMKLAIYQYPKPSDLIFIHTWPKTYQQKLFFVRDFRVMNDQNQIIAAATSAWLVINGTTRHLVPPRQLEALRLPNMPEEAGLNEPLEKLNLPEAGSDGEARETRFSDLDVVGHMNNSRQKEIAWVQVNFDKEVRYGEVLKVSCQPMTGQQDLFGVKGLNLSNDTRAFEALVQLRPQQG